MIDFLWTIWIAIEGVLFLLSFSYFRKIINNQDTRPYKFSINKMPRKIDSIIGFAVKIITIISLVVVIFCFVSQMSDDEIKQIYGWCNKYFIVSILPIFITLIQGIKNKSKYKWQIACVILGIVTSYIGDKLNSTYHVEMNKFGIIILFSLFASVFIVSTIEVFMDKEARITHSQRLGKGIRKDLYYCTTKFDLSISQLELIRCSERFFHEYVSKLNRMRKIMIIEYVSLEGVYINYWYKRAAKIMKCFVCVNLICILYIFYKHSFSTKLIVVLVLMVAFGLNIAYLKKKDEKIP